MDLTRRPAALLAGVLLALQGCASDAPFEYGEDALLLPATLGDALPLAEAQARAEYPNAYLTRMGGGFTVEDEQGRSHNHSFIFHARVGPSRYQIDVHLIHGSPWVQTRTETDPPPPFAEADLVLDSDGVVTRAIQLAPLNGVPLTGVYSARLSTTPAWPEPENVNDPGDRIAWRVDFLVLQPSGATTVYFSTARFYFDPRTGDLLGSPVVPSDPELYPFP
jgi:hypothetical protein